MNVLWQDVRFALRSLAQRPGLAFFAIASLALGIGANTIVFSGLYTILLQPLPYRQARRLVVVDRFTKQSVAQGVSYPEFRAWKTQGSAYSRMAATRYVVLHLMKGEAPERVMGSMVSEDFMDLLGVSPMLGRTFAAAEHDPGSAKTILLSHAMWHGRLAADPQVVGRTLRLDDQDYLVLGVMPPDFKFPFHAMFWTPLGPAEERAVLNDASDRRFGIVARLGPGVTLERAARETSLLAQRFAESEPLRLRQPDMRVRRLRDAIQNIGNYRMPILVLQFAVLFVLSIASLNLANLLMARNAGRKHEFAVRLALGAGKARLTRHLVVESMLLGLGGCLVSLPLAYLGFHALVAAITWRIPGLAEAGINAPVLAFTMIVALATSLAFGLAPAALASRSDPHALLASGAGRATHDRRRHRLSGALVVAEVGLAVLLLTASGMMIHAIYNLTQVNPGFDPERAVAISLSLPDSRYPSRQSLAAGLGQTVDRIRTLPGVEAIGAVSYLPLIGYNPGTDFTVVGRASGAPEQTPSADYQPVTPGYFKAMGVALRHGRAFTEQDMKPQPDTAIVNQALARQFWTGGDAIGRHIRLMGDDAPGNPLAIVGIVGDVQQFGIGTPPRPEIYVPLYRHSMTLIVRTAGPPGPMMATLQGAVKQLTHNQADLRVRTLEHVVAASLEKRRVFAWLLGAMAMLALALSVMGIYAVISHRTAERTREVGIRMALGAQAGDVRRLVVVQALTLTAIGIVGGLLTASAATRVMKRLLFGVGFVDTWTFLSVVVMLMGATLVACYWPARRATRIDPMEALRCE